MVSRRTGIKKAAYEKAANVPKVPRTGIEPAHCCQYQILSLTRLPIPPSGPQKGWQYYVIIRNNFSCEEKLSCRFLITTVTCCKGSNSIAAPVCGSDWFRDPGSQRW